MSENEVWCMNMGGWVGYGEEVAQTLRARDYKDPSILFIPYESYAMTTEMTPKIGKEVAPTLRGRDYKDPQIVFHKDVVGVDLYNQALTGEVSKTLNSIRSDSDHVPCALFWNGDDVVGTLTANNANNANGAQRMPDKANFGCILVEVDDARAE